MASLTKADTLKANLLEALEKSLGVVTTACKKVGTSRETFYKYCRTDEVFAKKVKELENVSLDYAESKLYQLMENGNAASVIFYLKTKGRHRGYIENLEITNKEIKIPEWLYEGDKS